MSALPSLLAAIVLLGGCGLQRGGLGGARDGGGTRDGGARPDGGGRDGGRDGAVTPDGGGEDTGPPPVDAAPPPALGGLRVELPCIAWVDATACRAAVGMVSGSTTLDGADGVVYEVTLRVRGVAEQNSYAGGSEMDGWYVGGAPDNARWNVFRIDVSDPPQRYFLNPGSSDIFRCFAHDRMHRMRVREGAAVTLSADAVDGFQVRNVDDRGLPIVIDGIPPAPMAFDGQFMQIDVVAISASAAR